MYVYIYIYYMDIHIHIHINLVFPLTILKIFLTFFLPFPDDHVEDRGDADTKEVQVAEEALIQYEPALFSRALGIMVKGNHRLFMPLISTRIYIYI